MVVRFTSGCDFKFDGSRRLANFSVYILALIPFWSTEHVVAIAVFSFQEHTKRIKLLMKPLQWAFVEKYRRSQFGYLSKQVALGQNPFAEFFRPSGPNAFSDWK